MLVEVVLEPESHSGSCVTTSWQNACEPGTGTHSAPCGQPVFALHTSGSQLSAVVLVVGRAPVVDTPGSRVVEVPGPEAELEAEPPLSVSVGATGPQAGARAMQNAR